MAVKEPVDNTLDFEHFALIIIVVTIIKNKECSISQDVFTLTTEIHTYESEELPARLFLRSCRLQELQESLWVRGHLRRRDVNETIACHVKQNLHKKTKRSL